MAALARRVSRHTAGSPAAVRPSWSQAASEHASRPIRSTASEPQPPEERDQRLRLARDARLPRDPTFHVDHADGGLVQRHVQTGEVLHGCSSSMLVADAHGPRSTILGGAATPVGSPNHSICPG
jgi:hypothetical protein